MRNDGQSAASVPTVHENTLVRIDPATNAVSDVVAVGGGPVCDRGRRAERLGLQPGRRHDHRDRRNDEPCAADDADLRHARRPRPSHRTGAGGRLGGRMDRQRRPRGRPLLTRFSRAARGKREYRLDHEPRAVAVGEGARLGPRPGYSRHQVLRIDPATGDVTARTRFPASSRIDSLDVGLGAVWVVSSSSGTLYRINPRSAAVTGRTTSGNAPADPKSSSATSGSECRTEEAPPCRSTRGRSMSSGRLDCCLPLGEGYDDVDGYGSIWHIDWPAGTVVRWDTETYDVDESISRHGPADL